MTHAHLRLFAAILTALLAVLAFSMPCHSAPNLIPTGDFYTPIGWTMTGGWSLQSNRAECACGSTYSILSWDLPIPSGRYVLSFKVKLLDPIPPGAIVMFEWCDIKALTVTSQLWREYRVAIVAGHQWRLSFGAATLTPGVRIALDDVSLTLMEHWSQLGLYMWPEALDK